MDHTSKNRRLEKLDQFVNLDEHVDCHLQFRTSEQLAEYIPL